MDNIKLALSIFCVTLVMACKSPEKVPTNKFLSDKQYDFPCELCEYWINVEKEHLPSMRYVTNAWPVVAENVLPNDSIFECTSATCNIELLVGWKEGPTLIYTYPEWKRAKAMRFCFIGKTKEEIRDIFAAAESFKITSTKNGLHFYSLIEPSRNKDYCSPSDIGHSWTEERYLQFINFSADSLFLGNHSDSTFLDQCQNRIKNTYPRKN